MALPLKNYDPGFVNSVVHTLTGSQIIFYLLHTWKTHPNKGVIVWCRKGDAIAKMNAIRVALARERKIRKIPRTFDLDISAVFPHEHLGIKGESIMIRRTKGTMITQMRAVVFESQQSNKRLLP